MEDFQAVDYFFLQKFEIFPSIPRTDTVLAESKCDSAKRTWRIPEMVNGSSIIRINSQRFCTQFVFTASMIHRAGLLDFVDLEAGFWMKDSSSSESWEERRAGPSISRSTMITSLYDYNYEVYRFVEKGGMMCI